MRVRRRRVVAVPLMLLVLSCGGKTDTDGETAGGTGAASSGTEGSDGGFGTERPLEECVEEGYPYDSANGRPCTYIADDICYGELSQACACICPRDRDSTCITGLWPDDFGRTDVFCE